MTDHHPTFAPSSWGRIEACPDSTTQIARSGLAKADTGGAGAKRGTKLHKRTLVTGEVDDLSEFDRKAVELSRDWLSEKRSAAAESIFDFGEAHTEERVSILDSRGELMTFGTVDRFWIGRASGSSNGYAALVCDLKFHPTGSIPEREAMLQLLAYSIGLMQEHDLSLVLAYLYAPHGPAEWHFSLERDDLPRFLEIAERLQSHTARALDDYGDRELDLRAGPHCQYCPALATCPAAERNLATVSEDLFALVLDDDGKWVVGDDRLFAEKWAQIKAAKALVKKFEDTAKEALGRSESEFLELREKAGNRYFPGAVPMAEDLPDEIREHITDEDIEALLKLSVGDLEGRFKDKFAAANGNRRGTKQEGARIFRKAMAELIAQGDPTYSVQFKRGKADAWKELPKD